ncbi:hypothetical protein QW131_33225 [Roseibium salinum]|nr:hypothetical protein [Roseibium salinum]
MIASRVRKSAIGRDRDVGPNRFAALSDLESVFLHHAHPSNIAKDTPLP